jgi:integrase
VGKVEGNSSAYGKEFAMKYIHKGSGLYLQTAKGKGSWVLRYMLNGKQREMGLGPARVVSSTEARKRAIAAQLLVLDGIDPVDKRKAERDQRRAMEAKSYTFAEVYELYMKTRPDNWSRKHVHQYRASIETYVLPKIGKLSVTDVEVGHITGVLTELWKTNQPTAKKIQERVESILGFATANKWRRGDNPARWDGHLKTIFATSHKTKHYAACPIADVSSFMDACRQRGTEVSKALQLLILTGTRTEELRGMEWSEVNLDQAEWTVPAERTKTKKELIVPLSTRAIEILRSLPPRSGRVFTFGEVMLWKCCKSIRDDITVHGFRSTFRDWVHEHTDFEDVIAEQALGHQVGNKTERSYRRGTALNKRRLMMQAWANYCHGVDAESNVTQLRGKAHA